MPHSPPKTIDELGDGLREFFREHVAPQSQRMDEQETTPRDLIASLEGQGCLSGLIPAEHGGRGWNIHEFGMICEEIGRVSMSLLSLVTVHAMTAQAIGQWGTEAQRRIWLPLLASGDCLGAFALTEPLIGCDAQHIQLEALEESEGFRLSGAKKWISYGQLAGVILVFAQCAGRTIALLVPGDAAGLSIKPLRGLLGFRASMMAELVFDGVLVPPDRVVGRVGFGVSHVAMAALDLGRYAIARGSVGLAAMCLEASVEYAIHREQFGVPLSSHQLIQKMLADMATQVAAARALCLEAARLRDAGSPDSIIETSKAKYFASQTAVRAAADALQLHGAHGCGPDSPVQRYYRDAKLTEIIEGSSQMQQLMIAQDLTRKHRRNVPAPFPRSSARA